MVHFEISHGIHIACILKGFFFFNGIILTGGDKRDLERQDEREALGRRFCGQGCHHHHCSPDSSGCGGAQMMLCHRKVGTHIQDSSRKKKLRGFYYFCQQQTFT